MSYPFHPLASRERRVGDVVVEELAPLHEHEGEVGAGPIEVGDQSLAYRSGGGQGRDGLGDLATGNGYTCNTYTSCFLFMHLE